MMDRESPLICYGKDGPVFERMCPTCSRYMKFPETLQWKQRFDDMCEFPKIECSKCGPVDPVHIGWTGDFR